LQLAKPDFDIAQFLGGQLPDAMAGRSSTVAFAKNLA
jgi:hypothetical protein